MIKKWLAFEKASQLEMELRNSMTGDYWWLRNDSFKQRRLGVLLSLLFLFSLIHNKLHSVWNDASMFHLQQAVTLVYPSACFDVSRAIASKIYFDSTVF